MKHLQAYLSYANDSARAAKYEPFITAQASAIASNALNSTGGVSSLWYSPSEGGAIFSGQSDTAGLAALLSAAQVFSKLTFSTYWRLTGASSTANFATSDQLTAHNHCGR